jgi:hypothetical protein
MNEKPMAKAVAKRFLLGDVDDLEREQIESRLIVDPETEATILIAEDELVEEYLEGSLSASDAAKFLKHYAYGPRQRRKLRIAESIKEYARAEDQTGQSERSLLQKLRRLLSPGWPAGRRFYIPIAVALATVVIVAGVWLVQWNNHRMQDTNLRLAIERELTELNAPSSLSETPPQMIALVLPSVSLRAVNSPSEITSQTAYRVVELQLLWPQKEESQSYLAVVRRVGGAEEFTIANLHAEQKPGGKVVRLRLPAQLLPPGLYRTSLSAAVSSGTPLHAEEYEFTIGR